MSSKTRIKNNKKMHTQSDEPVESVDTHLQASVDQEWLKENYRYYRDERKLFIDAERDVAKMFDQLLVAVASGVLTVSVANADKILKNGLYKNGLIISWILLVLTCICTLISLLLSQENWKIDRENLDIEQATTQNPELKTIIKKGFRKSVIRLNWIGLLCFVAALFILATVAFKNLS